MVSENLLKVTVFNNCGSEKSMVPDIFPLPNLSGYKPMTRMLHHFLLKFSVLFFVNILFSAFPLCNIFFLSLLSGGNQRELARAKAQKKAAEASKGSKDKTPAQQKRERHALLLSLSYFFSLEMLIL